MNESETTLHWENIPRISPSGFQKNHSISAAVIDVYGFVFDGVGDGTYAELHL